MSVEIIDSLNNSIVELRKGIDAKMGDFVSKGQLVELNAKLDKIADDLVLKTAPMERKAVIPTTAEDVLVRAEGFKASGKNLEKSLPWTSDYGRKFGDMRGFLKAVAKKSVLIEGTESLGGYLVPTEFAAEVIRIANGESIIFKLARNLPMSTWKRTLPKQLTNVSVAWVSESGTKTATNPTFGDVAQEAKVMAAIIKCSDELLRDEAINLNAFLAELIGEAMALETERVALVGDVSGASDSFNGVTHASGVNVVTMDGASVSFDDICDLIFSNGNYSANNTMVLSRAGLKILMKLKDTHGNYIWTPPGAGVSPMIWNVPYEISSQIASTYGTGADLTSAIVGDFSKYMILSPRQDMAVKISQDAYDAVDSTNAFKQDQTWFRFTKALSIDVAAGAAFGYLNFK